MEKRRAAVAAPTTPARVFFETLAIEQPLASLSLVSNKVVRLQPDVPECRKRDVPVDVVACQPQPKIAANRRCGFHRTRNDFAFHQALEKNRPKAANGSTWTIPIEARWYIYLAIAGLLTCLRKRKFVLTTILFFLVYQFGIFHAETNADRSMNREYGLYFCIGVLIWLYRDMWESRKLWVAITAVAAGTLVYILEQHLLAKLIVIAPFTVIIGSSSTPILRRFGRFGDVSYGIYIYAFMVQQTLIWAIGRTAPFSLHLALTVLVTMICAFLSWHCVEKPALQLKSFSAFLGSQRALGDNLPARQH
ncbi:acyltransferase [Burkholderia singularis]|uniref:acyltransferase family protein n=1 Tax=Burkholderia singularis TaxID=1503053 RepID=UPI0030018155